MPRVDESPSGKRENRGNKEPAEDELTVAAEPVDRAIREACKVVGTVSAGDGTKATVCRASPSFSASITAFVISSTNRGIPSARSMMSCMLGSSAGLFVALAAALVVYGIANVADVAGGVWFDTIKSRPSPLAQTRDPKFR